MRSILALLLGLAALFHPHCAHAETWWVPGDFPTIQAAIEFALPGDTVEVDPGVYVENLDFLGKDIAVRSTDGPAATVVDGGGLGSVVKFVSGETRNAVLEGFTLRGGVGEPGILAPDSIGGGGVICRQGSATIRGNWITDNEAAFGGGILTNVADPLIEGNRIFGNRAAAGGGVYVKGWGTELVSNEIRGNEAGPIFFEFVVGQGGGIYLDGVKGCSIRNNLIVENIADNFVFGSGGGVFWLSSVCEFRNNTVANNFCSLESGGGIYAGATDPILIENCIVFGNTEPQMAIFPESGLTVEYSIYPSDAGGVLGLGVLHADPRFVSTAAGEYFLAHSDLGQGATSPAVEAGSPGVSPISGTTTRTDGAPDEGTVDMGFHYPVEWLAIEFIRGDLNGDGVVDLADAIAGLGRLFVPGTDPGTCEAADDVNGDEVFDISDPIFLLSYRFTPGALPPNSPFPDCGPDDGFGGPVCDAFEACW